MTMNHLYLTFLEQFEIKFVMQGTHKVWTLFNSDDSDGPLRAAAWVTAHREHHRWSGQGCSRQWGAEVDGRQPGHDTVLKGIYFTNN